MPALGALIGGAAALANIGIGIGQRAKAKRLQKRLVRPEMQVQQEFVDNAAEAENMARVGMNQQQYNNALNNIRKNSTAGLRQLGRMGKPGGLASMVRAQNDATIGLDVKDAEMRRMNKLNSFQHKSILGGQKQAAWNWNKRDAYGEKLAEVQALKGAGMQNVGNGVNSAANLGMIMSQGRDLDLSSDPTMGGNFFSYNKNRSTYIGNRPQSVGYGIKQKGLRSGIKI